MIDVVHQVVPSLATRDAVGAHTLAVQRLLRELGYRSDVFTIHAAPDVQAPHRPLRALPSVDADRTAVVYQCSVGSPAADVLRARAAEGERLIVDYHNLTPVDLVAPWDGDMAYALAWGRRQLAELAPLAALGIGDSTLNAAELAGAGFERTAVAPVLVDPATFPGPPPGTRRRPGRWLFVGRIAPNKAQHDVVRAFAWYRALHDPQATLVLVGRPATAAYHDALVRAIAELDLTGAVILAGSVDDEELARHYGEADVFVCLSDHEGFCVPLLEAMHHGVPIVAYASSAVPETLGGAGLLLPTKDGRAVADAVAALDDSSKAALVEAGRRRLADFAAERTKATMRVALESALYA